MKEITKSFSDKAIRNAIGGFLVFSFLIYSARTDSKTFKTFYYVLILIPSFWLFIGWDLRKKYKSYPDEPAYENVTLVKWNGIIEIIFFFMLVIAFMLQFRKTFMSNFLLGTVFILYTFWLIYKWREISKVFRPI
jgi:hypothetical protein